MCVKRYRSEALFHLDDKKRKKKTLKSVKLVCKLRFDFLFRIELISKCDVHNVQYGRKYDQLSEFLMYFIKCIFEFQFITSNCCV